MCEFTWSLPLLLQKENYFLILVFQFNIEITFLKKLFTTKVYVYFLKIIISIELPREEKKIILATWLTC